MIKYSIALIIVWNMIVFFLFGWDKRCARKGKRRTPERTLLLSAFLCGGIGGFLGMRVFRHKTLHLRFRIMVPLFLLLTLGVVVVLQWRFQAVSDLFFAIIH